MIISGSQRGSLEIIAGQYFLTVNEWSADQLDSGTHGFNLRGLAAYIDVNAIANAPTVAPGLCVCIPSTGVPLAYCSPIGIVASDTIITNDGGKSITTSWITVQHFGYCERILFQTANPIDTADEILYTDGISSGYIRGCTVTEFRQLPGYAGVLELDTAAAGPVNVIFPSTNQPGSTWIAPLTKTTPAGVPSDRASFQIGWHYVGAAAQTIDEVRNGTMSAANAVAVASRQTKGFIACMGVAQPWS